MSAISSKTNGFVSQLGKTVPFLLVAVLSGCVDSGNWSENVGETAMSFEEFEARTFREPDTGIYIVDGDTPIDDIKKLEEFYEQHVRQGALIVHRPGGQDAKWNDTQKMQLTYCVSNTFGTRYQAAVTAMEQATAAWEQVTNVNFTHVTAQDSNCTASNQNVLFDVRPTSSGGYLARAFFPGDSRSSRNILISTSAFQSNGNPTVTGVLRHELGHVLGFRHEHTRPEAGTCFEDNQWRALTPYDSKSVMHYPQCNGTGDKTLSLTQKDIDGAVLLYGEPGGGGGGGGAGGAGGGGAGGAGGAGGGGAGGAGGGPGEPVEGTPMTATWNGTVLKYEMVQLEPVDVVEGTSFEATMTGSGDPDLYVRFGTQPTKYAWHCRPYKTGPNEKCTLTVPTGVKQAFMMVRGYKYGQFNVTANYTTP
ncbi:MAG: matrixin family metalloprotease [Polyangiaceae bacterium]|nr:matrixin family metalloprotease [Polyangiaceae bacterium]